VSVFVLHTKILSKVSRAAKMTVLSSRLSSPNLFEALQRTAEALRADELIYRFRLRPDRGCEYIGPAVERMTGRTAEDFYANPDLALELIVDEDLPLVRNLLDDPGEREGPVYLRWRHADGSIVWTEVLRAPIRDESGTIVAVEGVMRDVTERKEMELRLLESRQRLRELSAHTEEAREEERRRLARTLHDELGQLFSSIRLELAAAITLFRESGSPQMRPIVDRLQAAAGLTDIGVVSLRQLTTALRPPILDHLGLAPAIRWEASIFSRRTGIRCHVRARPAEMMLDEAHVTALYRILLAALDNINRHAGAGTVWIHLTQRHGMTLMEVRDNGRGITDAQINNPRSMGLLGMRERALALGGEVRVTRGRRNGTRLLVILPEGDAGA
jgi:two-component system sensor histidine kinase UhpB